MQRDGEYLKYEEEKPLLELPALIFLAATGLCLIIAMMLLFLPWYLAAGIFFAIAITIGIILNPFIAIPLYLVGAYVQPMAFFPELAQYQLPVIAAFGILLIWMFHIMIYRDFKIPKSNQVKCLLVFVGILVFSSITNWEYNSFSFLDMAKVIVLYFLVSNLVKTKTQVKNILFFSLLLGSMTALFGIYQQMHGLGGTFGGGVTRALGFEGNPNHLAIDMVLLIPIVLGLLRNNGNFISRGLFLVLCGLFVITVILTYSRAGVFGLAIVLLLAVWKFLKMSKKIAYFLIGLTVTLMALPYVPVVYIERVMSIANLQDVSIVGRLDGLIVGFWMMLEHPFLGVGLGRWAYAYWEKAITLPAVATKLSYWPHNIFIEVGAELGVLALISFLLLLFFVFKDLNFSKKIFLEKRETLLSTVAETLEIGLIGFLCCAFFAAAVHLKLVWMLMGFSVSLKQLAMTYKDKG